MRKPYDRRRAAAARGSRAARLDGRAAETECTVAEGAGTAACDPTASGDSCGRVATALGAQGAEVSCTVAGPRDDAPVPVFDDVPVTVCDDAPVPAFDDAPVPVFDDVPVPVGDDEVERLLGLLPC